MSELIHQHHGRLARQNSVQVHFFKQRALVLDFLARHNFELRSQFFDCFAAVRFDDADHHIFVTAVAADGFAEHRIRFADARRISQK